MAAGRLRIRSPRGARRAAVQAPRFRARQHAVCLSGDALRHQCRRLRAEDLCAAGGGEFRLPQIRRRIAHDPRLHAGAGERADAAPRRGRLQGNRAIRPAPAGRGDDDLLYAFGAAQRSRALHRRRARRLRLGGDRAEGDDGLMHSVLMVRRRAPGGALALSGAPSRTMRPVAILRDAAPQTLTEYTDLILRSLRSKRLEGSTQHMDSRPSFETRAGALLRMRRSRHLSAERVQVSPPQSMPTQPSTLKESGPGTEMLLT